ncbi:MAG: efflux RND transporter periplasmic adaptor subunit [Candidatus Acidiferrum sp.]
MTTKKLLIIAALVVLAIVVFFGFFRHGKTEADDTNGAEKAAGAPVAAVVRVGSGTLGTPLTLAGAFKPFQDVDIHAKVAGYIKKMYVDVGTRVQEGQTMAMLEVPELAAQLAGADAAVRRSKEEIRRAEGDVQRAKSAHAAAHAMNARLQAASDQQAGLVAQQEVDDARAKDLEAEAQVSSAQAALSAAEQALDVAVAEQARYRALSDYTRISAPFSGVVTVRYADVGSLIAAGTSNDTTAEPVVRLAQISVLRLVLPVPESIAGQIRLGDAVKVHVQALNQDSVGKVSRFADALDQQTRTMHTEIDFPNPDGRLLPGMYVEARIGVAEKKNMLTVPLEAVEMNGSEGTALVVNSQNVIEERKVQLGLQGSTRVEVVSGLSEGERVVVGSRNEYRAGMKVTPKEINVAQPGAAGEK